MTRLPSLFVPLILTIGLAVPAARAQITPGALSLPLTTLGFASTGQTVVINNPVGSGIVVAAATLHRAECRRLSVHQQLQSALTPGQSCKATFAFKPTAAGLRSGIVLLSGPGLVAPVSFGLTGTAQPQQFLNPLTVLPFTSPFGLSLRAQTTTVTNGNPIPIDYSSYGVQGTNAGDYSIAGTSCSFPLAPGATCSLTMAFNPHGVGFSLAELHIRTTNSFGDVIVYLNGSGDPALRAPVFSLPPGTYLGPQTVSFAPYSQPITQILYTTDGSDPGTNFPLNTASVGNGASIFIEVSETVRALADGRDALLGTGPIGSSTYVIIPEISTIAGVGTAGFAGDGGAAVVASPNAPAEVAVDQAGNWYVLDQGNHRIRKVDAAAVISTSFDGTTRSGFLRFTDLTSDSVGEIYVGFLSSAGRNGGAPNLIIDRLDPTGATTNVAAFTPSAAQPTYGLAVGASTLYFIDRNCVRAGSATSPLRDVTRCGSGGTGVDGGPAANVSLVGPTSLLLTTGGSLLVADTADHRVRAISPAGLLATVAGDGGALPGGDGGPGVSAGVPQPKGLALDAGGSLFVVSGATIRKVAPDGTIWSS